jgi:hypothetical protein
MLVRPAAEPPSSGKNERAQRSPPPISLTFGIGLTSTCSVWKCVCLVMYCFRYPCNHLLCLWYGAGRSGMGKGMGPGLGMGIGSSHQHTLVVITKPLWSTYTCTCTCGHHHLLAVNMSSMYTCTCGHHHLALAVIISSCGHHRL